MVASYINRNENSIPFDSGCLKDGELHNFYYEQHGNPNGKPAIYLHGSSCNRTCLTSDLMYFDLSMFRVVLVDHGSAGESIYKPKSKENTSQALAQCIESLRIHLSIPKWHLVFGGPWGSSLAMLYAQKHPHSVSSLVLHGVFLLTDEELVQNCATKTSRQGLYGIFPDMRERWLQYLASMTKITLCHTDNHQPQLNHQDEYAIEAVPSERSHKEVSMIKTHENTKRLEQIFEDIEFLLSFARIEAIYFKASGWLKGGQLLEKEGIEKLKNIPVAIVQGRYDVVCPAKVAFKLYEALGGEKGKCELFLTTAGHKYDEPDTVQKLIDICRRYGEMSFV